MNCHVRLGVKEDAPGILLVHRSAILQLGPLAYREDQCRSWAFGLDPEQYIDAMSHQGETFWVAEANGMICGFCSYLSNEIKGLYVHPQAARKGVGSNLLGKAEADILSLGHHTIRLTAALSAEAFYRKHGYQSERVKTWISRGGLEMPVMEMTRTVA